MEKDPSTKFCGFLISSREVIKLQSFESCLSASDIYQRTCKTFYLYFSLHIVVNFMKKEPFTHFYGRFDHKSNS